MIIKLFNNVILITLIIICLVFIAAIFWALHKLEQLNPFKKPKKAVDKSYIDTTYRDTQEKEMYKRMARSVEREARMENEIRDRLNKK